MKIRYECSFRKDWIPLCYYIKRKSPFFECEKECICITKNCMHLYREKCTCILVRPGYLWSEIFSRKLLKLYGFLWSFFSNSETINHLLSKKMGKYSKLLIKGNSNKEKIKREKNTFERLAQLILVLQRSYRDSKQKVN